MQSEVISKLEAARRWKISGPAVSKYIRRGMPTRGDGKVDWPAVDQWRRAFNVATRSGNYARRQEAAAPGEKYSEDADYAFARLSLRKELPALIATMRVPDSRVSSVEIRIGLFAIVDHLLGVWSESSAHSPAIMPEIDWSGFTDGIDPERARGLFEMVQADFPGRRPTASLT